MVRDKQLLNVFMSSYIRWVDDQKGMDDLFIFRYILYLYPFNGI